MLPGKHESMRQSTDGNLGMLAGRAVSSHGSD